MKLAIFDFNGTIFTEETLPFILLQWYKHNYSKKRLLKVFVPMVPLYLKYKMGLYSNISKEQMEVMAVEKVSNIFKGMNKKDLNNFFARAASSANKYYNENIIDEISKSKKRGYKTVILSGAFKPFLEVIAENIGIDTVIGSELYFENYNSNLALDIISGSNKLKKLKQCFGNNNIDWQESCAYADSYHDLQLLEKVGKPVAVNPDNKLKLIANKRNWPVVYSEEK